MTQLSLSTGIILRLKSLTCYTQLGLHKNVSLNFPTNLDSRKYIGCPILLEFYGNSLGVLKLGQTVSESQNLRKMCCFYIFLQ